MSAYGADDYGSGRFGGTPPAPDSTLGTPPLLQASPWERAAHQGGARPIARLTVESGGGQPVELVINDTDLDVTRTLTRGTQWLASATVLREPGQDTEDRVTTPGAIFRLSHGWDYGAGYTELRPFGVYQLAKIPTSSRTEPLRLELHDRWAQLVECEALTPVDVDVDPATAITALVHQVDPTIEVIVNATGNPTTELREDTSRSNLIIAVAQDAQLYPHFDAAGRFVIDPAPTEQPPVASLSDGENATLIGVSTEVLNSTPYNCVVINPSDGDGFDPYVLHVGDLTHPRHRTQPGMGIRPYRTTSDLEGAELHTFALNLLAQLVGGVHRRSFSTWGRGDLNPGDWLAAIEAGTYLIPQRTSVSMVEEIRHNPLTVSTEIVTRSTPRILTEEG